jgi:pyruvate kinase
MTMHKKTKIVATIGPVSESEEMLTEMVKAGLNVMRLNFSHGDHKEHQNRVDNARKVIKKTGRPLAILQDLSGPKIRIGEFYKERVVLKPGSTFTLTTEKIVGDETKVYVNYPTLPQELKKGNAVLLDDGKKRLEVIDIQGNEVVCKVIVGGETKGKRGVNLPGAYLKISSITEKDREDLKFGIKNKVDFVALSFVRRPEDILELREMLTKAKSQACIIAKIETQEAIENLDAIIELTDGVMVARGDLAIEVPAEKVPLIQKRIVRKCNMLGKPVITATQMLESMIKSPVPTRAEVSDVANAILDGTDAIMLSEETTLGEYPIEAVNTMYRIANEIETNYPHKPVTEIMNSHHRVVDSVSSAVVHSAGEVKAKLIVALTEYGTTARMISRYKPPQCIIGCSPNEKTVAQLSLTFGCIPFKIAKLQTIKEALAEAKKLILKHKLASKGDRIVVSAGMPFAKRIDTNMMMVDVL